MRFPNATPEEIKQAHGYAYGGAIIQDMGYYPHGSFFFRAWWSRRQSRGIRMHVAQNFHHMLWIWEHWKLDGIVGGGAVFAITCSILNAVRNKTLNSRVFKIVRESAVPVSEQEISNLLEIRLA